MLGQGAFGKVIKAQSRQTDATFAIKILKPRNERERETCLDEFRLFQRFDSDHIVKCTEVYHFNGKIWAVLSYMDGNSMSEIISERHREYSESFCKYTLWCVLCGLKQMHDQGVLHRDIKPDNILCSSDGQIRISDLGFSACLSEAEASRTTGLGTLGVPGIAVPTGFYDDRDRVS